MASALMAWEREPTCHTERSEGYNKQCRVYTQPRVYYIIQYNLAITPSVLGVSSVNDQGYNKKKTYHKGQAVLSQTMSCPVSENRNLPIKGQTLLVPRCPLYRGSAA